MVALTDNMSDHNYNLIDPQGACGDSDDTEMEESSSKTSKINQSHTPVKNPNRKKMKGNNTEKTDVGAAILQAVRALTEKVDEQTDLLKRLDKRIEENTSATKQNKQDIILLTKKIEEKNATTSNKDNIEEDKQS